MNITCHMSWMLIDTCYEFITHLECSWMQWCMFIVVCRRTHCGRHRRKSRHRGEALDFSSAAARGTDMREGKLEGRAANWQRRIEGAF